MKTPAKNIFRTLFVAAFILSLIICSQAQTRKRKQPRWNWENHQDEIIGYAKKYPVSNIEPTISRMNFEHWFQQLVGKESKVNWDINDCGEQTGTAEDRGRNFPLCVEISAVKSGSIFIRVNIQFGTFGNKSLKMKPVVRSIIAGDEINGQWLDNLEQLSNFLQTNGKSLADFDPNDCIFYVRGDKPEGFEEFTQMWLATAETDSKGKSFPVKKYGGFEFGQSEFKLQNIFFDGEKWSFQTEVIENVSFSFNGKFVEPKTKYSGANPGDRILQGHLIKFSGGKIAAQADLIFDFAIQGE